MKKIALLLLFLLPSFCYGQSVQEKAKAAFAQVKMCKCEKCDCIDCKCTSDKCACAGKAKSAFDAVKIDCVCQNCDCVACTCTKEKCECNDFQAIYARCVKNEQVIVLAVAAPKIQHEKWKIVELPKLSGEKPGYIVGVPKNGTLIRLDFPPNTPRQRIQLDILHVYYPLGNGYVECPTCPQGRIKSVSTRNPNGHTHTCTSCGTTWDHTANPTHTCQNCGGHPPISRNGGYEADVARPIRVTAQSR